MAILAGLFRIARDAELRSLPDGTPVINLALAYDYGTKKNERQRRNSASAPPRPQRERRRRPAASTIWMMTSRSNSEHHR
jgi:hypothetical protein